MQNTGAGLHPLDAALRAYELDRLSGGALCEHFRAQARSWPGLPARFLEVLETLLQPLESSALFSEESCAFSRHDLADSLRQWLHAALRKAPPMAEPAEMTTASDDALHRSSPG